MKSGVLMTGGKDKAIKIWDIRTGFPHLLQLSLSFSYINAHLWHTHANGWREHRLAGHCEQTLTAHTGGVKALQFDSAKLVSGGSDGKIFVWDLRSTYTCTLA